jgi:hypothetical protein
MDRTWAEQAKGKTIASLEWDDEGDYWVMTFTDGSEICWAETMAERAADAEEAVARERATRELVEAQGGCCRAGHFVGGVTVPKGWSLLTGGGGVLCSFCGAIWRLGPDGVWSKEPAPGGQGGWAAARHTSTA